MKFRRIAFRAALSASVALALVAVAEVPSFASNGLKVPHSPTIDSGGGTEFHGELYFSSAHYVDTSTRYSLTKFNGKRFKKVASLGRPVSIETVFRDRLYLTTYSPRIEHAGKITPEKATLYTWDGKKLAKVPVPAGTVGIRDLVADGPILYLSLATPDPESDTRTSLFSYDGSTFSEIPNAPTQPIGVLNGAPYFFGRLAANAATGQPASDEGLYQLRNGSFVAMYPGRRVDATFAFAGKTYVLMRFGQNRRSLFIARDGTFTRVPGFTGDNYFSTEFVKHRDAMYFGYAFKFVRFDGKSFTTVARGFEDGVAARGTSYKGRLYFSRYDWPSKRLYSIKR